MSTYKIFDCTIRIQDYTISKMYIVTFLSLQDGFYINIILLLYKFQIVSKAIQNCAINKL